MGQIHTYNIKFKIKDEPNPFVHTVDSSYTADELVDMYYNILPDQLIIDGHNMADASWVWIDYRPSTNLLHDMKSHCRQFERALAEAYEVSSEADGKCLMDNFAWVFMKMEEVLNDHS